MKKIMISVFVFVFLFSGVAYAIIIDFESTGLIEGDVITNQIFGLSFGGSAILAQVNNGTPVAFEAPGGDDMADAPFDVIGSFFITDTYGPLGFDDADSPIEMVFDAPVFNLSFAIADLDGSASAPEIMTASAFDISGVLLESIVLVGSGVPDDGTSKVVTFSQVDIKRLEVLVERSPMRLGYGIDNIQFSQLSEPVPEPATMLLLGSGLVGFAGLRRKSKK